MADRRLRQGEGCRQAPCPACFEPHVARVEAASADGVPLRLVLPAFPAKSPSPRKTMGELPDLGEQLALIGLQALCTELSALHPPGVRLVICSDGHVFADVVGVSDDAVSRYRAALGAIIEQKGLSSLELFSMQDALPDMGFEAMRTQLMSGWATGPERLEAPFDRALFDGIHRFLFEERVGTPGKSRSRVRAECAPLARELIRRSAAWSRLIAERFPYAVRLSIHPQPAHSAKIGIRLGGEGRADGRGAWITPWHAAPVLSATGWRLMHRAEAEAEGARPTATHFLARDITPLSPFGIRVEGHGAPLPAAALLESWIAAHRVVVLRGFADPQVLDLARSLGEPLLWSFGAVNELAPRTDAVNYLYTRSAVPFHWDGAFLGTIPRFILFHCLEAPAEGGETLFCDTTRVLDCVRAERRALWSTVNVTYRTEKLAHYGGAFTSPILGKHPVTGETTLRFAEPVDDLNPVELELCGVAADLASAIVDDLGVRLREPDVCLIHRWVPGDLVLADNHALLHGRRAFAEGTPRRIRRVNVI
jgi:pyoverdine/dityrosine biosynthesis protein Dit1/alpha-ketoglutarate-dependent taurine dioxygenase